MKNEVKVKKLQIVGVNQTLKAKLKNPRSEKKTLSRCNNSADNRYADK